LFGKNAARRVSESGASQITFDYESWEENMEGPLRGCLAGAAAWKWGGGCLSTIIIFIIVYILLGHVKC